MNPETARRQSKSCLQLVRLMRCPMSRFASGSCVKLFPHSGLRLKYPAHRTHDANSPPSDTKYTSLLTHVFTLFKCSNSSVICFFLLSDGLMGWSCPNLSRTRESPCLRGSCGTEIGLVPASMVAKSGNVASLKKQNHGTTKESG